MSKTRRISARCEEDLFDALRDQAEEANMTLPEYLRYVCQEAILPDRRKELKSEAVAIQERVKFGDKQLKETKQILKATENNRDKLKEKLENSELANIRLKSVVRQFNKRGFFARLFNIKPNMQGIDLSN